MDEPWVEADLRDGAESIINKRRCSHLHVSLRYSILCRIVE